MSPTLRSAQSSPAGRTVGQEMPTRSTTPSRKAPQCSQCGRPRAGHPRSGCPFADSGANGDTDDVLISGALLPLNIQTPQGGTTNEEQKPRVQTRKQAKPLRRNNTQLSLTTTTNEIVGHLSQSGIFDDVIEGNLLETKAKLGKLVRWQDAVNTSSPPSSPVKVDRPLKSRPSSRSIMPGTLIPPSPFSSFDSMDSEGEPCMSANDDRSAMGQKTEPSPFFASPQPQARPLARSMSCMERDLFIANLSCDALATVYVVPKADVDSILEEAQSLKFFTAEIMNEDHRDDQALLVVGRTESAVQTLLKKIEDEHRKLSEQQQPRRPSSRSSLKVIAGSALVGAVGAWAGLAFS